MEVLWQKAGSKSTEKDTLERHLNWAYKEVGYVERNRSASSNPRAVDEPRDLGVSLGSIQPSRREIAQKVLDTFAAAGFGQFQQVAALANAIAESGLDPGAHTPAPEDAVGLFLLNRDIGLGKGHTTQELEDPSTNIEIVMQEAKKLTEFSTATSLDDAVDIFTRRIERPRNMGDEIIKRRRIARQILPLRLGEMFQA